MIKLETQSIMENEEEILLRREDWDNNEASVQKINVDDDWTKDGDLGLGLGLKPGGIPNFCTSCLDQSEVCSSGSVSTWTGGIPHFAYKCRKQQRQNHQEAEHAQNLLKIPNSSFKCKLKRAHFCEHTLKTKQSTQETFSLKNPPDELWEEVIGKFGVVDDKVSINSSIRKQRSLFQSELKEIFGKHISLSSLSVIPKIVLNRNCENSEESLLVKSLQEELKVAHEKIDILQAELEVYQQLLLAKYKASELLLYQLRQMNEEKTRLENETKLQCAELQKIINSLQFNLEYTESQLTESQISWLERFDSVSKDNLEIAETLKSQEKLIKMITAEKIILKHERDELLAVLDAKEKLSYHQYNSLSSDDSWSEITSLELGVLGACTCRGASQVPCNCARMACIKQYKITDLSNEVQELQKQLKEALSMIDVYREVFEEQLKKNRCLTKRLSDIEAIYETAVKSQRKNGFINIKKQTVKDKSEIINSLVDLLCDKNEELIQQRLVSKILAKKIVEINSFENGMVWTGSAPESLECVACCEEK